MPKLREGDIVTFRARVTRVADYDEDQQILAKILPKGQEIGWCVPKENAFTPDELVLRVGDRARRVDMIGEDNVWEIKALFDDKQVAVQKIGNWPVQITVLDNLMRL